MHKFLFLSVRKENPSYKLKLYLIHLSQTRLLCWQTQNIYLSEFKKIHVLNSSNICKHFPLQWELHTVLKVKIEYWKKKGGEGGVVKGVSEKLRPNPEVWERLRPGLMANFFIYEIAAWGSQLGSKVHFPHHTFPLPKEMEHNVRTFKKSVKSSYLEIMNI